MVLFGGQPDPMFQRQNLSVKQSKSGLEPPRNNSNLTYHLIPGYNNTWGYDILLNGKLYIHQPMQPGVVGNNGFITRKEAAYVAKLVIEKIKKKIFPPTVAPLEFKQ